MKIIRFFSNQLVLFSVFLISTIPFITKCSPRQENHQNDDEQDNQEHQNPRINKIITSEPWQDYKQIWIELDEKRNYFSDSVGIYDFNGYSSYDTFYQRLDTVMIEFKQLEGQGLLNPLEVEIFEKIAQSRIKYQSGYLHMVRMMPAPLEYQKEALNRMDARIDTLMALRIKKIITEEMAETLLSNILLDLERFVYMDAVATADQGYYFYDIYLETIPDFDKQLKLFEAKFDSLRDSGLIEDSVYQNYLINIDEIRLKIETLDTLLTRMEPLFRDLVRY
ncbi:MAG: hypothetical protein ACP5FK_07330 [bacterium]